MHDDPVLVFQVGKVGSASIVNSLTKAGIYALHVHSIESFLQFNYKSSLPPFRFTEDEDRYIRDKFAKMKKLRIITAVREPIARDLSQFFQKFGELSEMFRTYNMIGDEDLYDTCLKYLDTSISSIYEPGTQEILPKYKGLFRNGGSFRSHVLSGIQHGKLFDWFDLELKSVFGVDVYDYPFDKEKGYVIIENENVDVLVYRLENLNDLEGVIGDFVGCGTDFRLESRNISSERVYGDFYNEFRNRLRLPQEYIDFYYKGNPRMDHFYSEDEKQQFLSKWTR